MINDQRPAILHAGSPRVRRAEPGSRAEWRRHLHHEPPGLLRKMHKSRSSETTDDRVSDA